MSTSPALRPTGRSVTLRRRTVYAVVAVAVACGTLSVAATAFAKGGDGGGGGDARSRVACGSGGQLELRAKADDGGTEGRVKGDRKVKDENWLVTLTDNGRVRWSQTRTTARSSGSFEVETLLTPGDDSTATGSGTSMTSTSSTGSTTTSTTSSGSSTTSGPSTTSSSS